MNVFFSSGAFGHIPLSAMLTETENTPGTGLELSSALPFAPDLEDNVRAAANRGFPLLVHNYFPPPERPFVLNLAATDPEIRQASLDLARRAINLTAAIGAPFYSVHSGFAMNLTADQLGNPAAQSALRRDSLIDRATAENSFLESVRTLACFARSKGVRLLVENNVITRQQVTAGRADTLLMTSPEDARDFFAALADDSVGLLLDVAHAKVAAGALGFPPERFFEMLPERIHALHLSDNDGSVDNNQPFARDAWFAPHARQFAHLPQVIEVYYLDANERASQLSVLVSMLK